MFLSTLDTAEKLLVFLITLSILVLVHEGGHFFVARLNRVAVTEFALGFGPALFSFRSPRSGTRYRVNCIPLGGYCAMVGEDAESSGNADVLGVQGVDYATCSVWQRFAIVAAGPLVNLAMAFVILLASGFIFGVPSEHGSTVVGELIPGDPAQRAGLQTGDRIVLIDGRPVTDGEHMVAQINASLGKTLTVVYLHRGISHAVRLTPIPMLVHGKRVGITGFSPQPEFQHIAPGATLLRAGEQLAGMWTSTVNGLGDLFVHPKQASDQLVGPVGMARAGMAIQDYGWGTYLSFAAFLSLGLGIFNLLPIPALDGGRILFIFVEMLRGRALDADKEALVHVTGFATLMAFVLFRTYHDILNLVAGKSAL